MISELHLDTQGDIPILEGWITLPRAGELLGVTRQNAYKMAKHKKFKSLCRIQDSHVVLVSVNEVQFIGHQRALAKAAQEAAAETS